jgi:heme/copper-type cytochrome/quinol oxidase subunit 2
MDLEIVLHTIPVIAFLGLVILIVTTIKKQRQLKKDIANGKHNIIINTAIRTFNN